MKRAGFLKPIVSLPGWWYMY